MINVQSHCLQKSIKQKKEPILTMSLLPQVGIVSFVDDVKTPNGENCYREQLALAIPTNIRNMKKFVENQHASSGKNFDR